MKNKIILFTLLLLFPGTMAFAQKVIKIGETEFTIQSPFKVITQEKSANDFTTLKKDTIINNSELILVQTYSKPKSFRHNITEFYIGLGFATPIGSNNALPVYYGNSFNLEIGFKYLYRPAKGYAIGTFIQYSCYSYKLKNNNQDLFDLGIATTSGRQYYRTDNLGTGIINRFYLFPQSRTRQVYIDLGAYGDYSYSKRVKIKDKTSGGKQKYKYRDGSKFNPFQAGVFAAIGYNWISVYGKYRLTNCFNHNEVDVADPTRLSIGIQFAF